jgi:hypothetical protein
LTGGKEQQADLYVNVYSSHEIAYVGARTVVHLTLNNGGPDPAQGVTVDYTPYGLWAATVHPSRGTCTLPARGAFTCKLGNLAPLRSATATVTGFAKHRGHAEPDFVADSATTDPDAANNERAGDVIVWLPVQVKGVRTPPGGTAKLTLYAFMPGTLVVRATRGGQSFARAAKEVRRAGRFRLVIAANAKARAYLERNSTVRAVLRVTFTPKGGRPSTQSLRVVLKR